MIKTSEIFGAFQCYFVRNTCSKLFSLIAEDSGNGTALMVAVYFFIRSVALH